MFDRANPVCLGKYRLNKEFINKTSDLNKNGHPLRGLIRFEGLEVATIRVRVNKSQYFSSANLMYVNCHQELNGSLVNFK